MAVPKRKQSKQRTNSRFANYVANTPTLVECPRCKAMMQSHRVCAKCGFYDKVEVVVHKEEKKD